MPFNQFASEGPILCFHRMVYRFLQKMIGFEPQAGSPVQFGYLVALVGEQQMLQQIGEEMVKAVPFPLVIQGNEKKVGAFDL